MLYPKRSHSALAFTGTKVGILTQNIWSAWKQHQECAKAVNDKLESMKMKRLATLDDRASLKLLQLVL
jgi:hypothetical protein